VWAWIHLGLGFTAVRALAAVAQSAGPFLLFDFVARRDGEETEESRQIALLGALLWTLAPLANCLALSAQAETWFTLLVLGTAWTVERRRSVLAGALLAAACLVRYEAWGAIPALALLAWKRRGDGPGIAAVLLPSAAIAAWILLRRHADGEWLAFLVHTQRFAGGVRAAQGRPLLVDALLIPLALPLLVIGPAIVLLPLGLRRSIRTGWAVPAGVLCFLVLSHLGRGALGLERYLTALTPFACVAVADGARILAERRRSPSASAGARRMAAGIVALMALTTAGHLVWTVYRARTREAELRGYQADAERS
jgi:hypothetical protein